MRLEFYLERRLLLDQKVLNFLMRGLTVSGLENRGDTDAAIF